MRLSELAGRRVAILGFGREGAAALEALRPVAGSIVVVDASPDSLASVPTGVPTATEVEALTDAAGREEAGGEAPVAVVSPGVPRVHPWRRWLREAGWEATSGTDLWFGDNASRTIAVTGSKGKSTTSSLIAHLLAALGTPVAYGGNIGTPLLALEPAESYVVELSSFQASSLTVSPRVVVLTSLFPDHVDWHGGLDEYFADKLNVLAGGPEAVVANSGDAVLRAELDSLHPDAGARWAPGDGAFALVSDATGAHVERDGARVLTLEGFAPPGPHNRINLCLALEALVAWGVELDAIATLGPAIAAFRPLAHRLETVAVSGGLEFVDDTLSTNPYAAIKALDAFADRDVTVIIGGHDRGVDYDPLVTRLRERPVRALLALPENGPRIAEAVGPTTAIVRHPRTLAEAVALAREVTPEGGVVLLSPAAPSYNAYANYEEKAQDFRDAIASTDPAAEGTTG